MTPPTEVYIGMVDGEWPIQAFANEAHALRWMQDAKSPDGAHRVHLWLCRLDVQQEMTVLPASAPRLIPRYEGP